MSWTIRPGRLADVPALHALDVLCFKPPFRFTLRAMRGFVERPGASLLVAEAEGAIAGFLLVHLELEETGEPVGYLVTLDIAPAHRRLGLAQRLLGAAEAETARRATRMALHVHAGNTAARQLYRRCGYAQVAVLPDFYGDGLEGLLLVKDLPRPVAL